MLDSGNARTVVVFHQESGGQSDSNCRIDGRTERHGSTQARDPGRELECGSGQVSGGDAGET